MRSPSPYHHREPSPEEVLAEGLSHDAPADEVAQPTNEHVEDQTVDDTPVVPSDLPADEANEVEQMETN